MKKFLGLMLGVLLMFGCATTGALVQAPPGAKVVSASYQSAYERHAFMAESTFCDLGDCITNDYGESFCLLAEATHKISEGGILDIDPDAEFVIQYVDTDTLDADLDGSTDFAFIMLILPNMQIIEGRQFWLKDNPQILIELADQFEKQFGYRYEMTWAKEMNIPDGWDPRNHEKYEDPDVSRGEEF